MRRVNYPSCNLFQARCRLKRRISNRKEDYTMDEGTEILISLASANAANCIPCFDHYFQEAMNQKITYEDVQKTMEISAKIKGAAAMFTKKAINETMGVQSEDIDCPCGDQGGGSPHTSCC